METPTLKPECVALLHVSEFVYPGPGPQAEREGEGLVLHWAGREFVHRAPTSPIPQPSPARARGR